MKGDGVSKGNRKVVVRIEPALWALIEEEIGRAESDPLRPPHTVSSWVRQAMLDKLRHADRSRKVRRPALGLLTASPPLSDSR
jgi:hypothetical protein